MKRPTGSPRLYLASSESEKTQVANSEQKLRSTLATLEQCRAVLLASASRETAQLVSVAILQLRMKLNRIADSELKALCDAMTPDHWLLEGSQCPPSPQGRPRRAQPVLKLVK
jgi:hypothetical protein